MDKHTPKDAIEVGRTAQMRMEGAVRTQVDLSDVITVTVRLAQLLAQEVDYLDAMKIRELEGLQEEKRKLAKALVMMKREIERNPDVKKSFKPADVDTFTRVSEIFDGVLEENYRKLLVSKEINLRIVQAISDVVKEETLRTGYNKKGLKGHQREAPPSVSLNETI